MDADLDQDILAFWSLVFEIIGDLEKRLAQHLAAHQLTPPQFYVLKTLFEHDGRCRIGQIAEEHHLSNAAMTGLVKRLEVNDLVRRERNTDDGRSVDVLLTETGMARFWAVQNSLMEQARTVMSMIPSPERKEAMQKVHLYFQMLREQFPVEGE